jgi:hypothetical protein
VKEAREALQSILKSLGLEERVRGFKAAAAWPEVAGSVLGSRSTVLDFEGGRLVVEAGSAVVMQELAMRRAELLREFEARFGPGLVREIMLVPAGGSHATGR